MISALLLTFALQAQAQAPEQIQNLAGCFSVSYRFVEDGQHELDISGSYELIELQARPDGSYFLQHYGILDGEKFKHLAETWSPETSGQWKQTILSPSGSFRYECVAPFVANQFSCFAKDAPKPNRDSEREDYETLDRQITLQITPKVWAQSENNVKRDASKRFVSNEVGWIEYKRVEAQKCVAP